MSRVTDVASMRETAHPDVLAPAKRSYTGEEMMDRILLDEGFQSG